MSKFKTKEYWNQRKNPNNNKVNRSDERAFIKKYTEGAESVLDFGCGVGAMSKEYPVDAYIEGVDFVDTYRDRWKNNTRQEEVWHVVHDVHEKDLPFKDQHFDVCVLSKVLDRKSVV